ncbi:hypothetical protein P691DRAFT_784188 [Macrolepiota fuliginosa MF-IS2]|uniref:Uncharacterized protein n=1 Tax=Macrolepiota fuliginosa MF-IS2 TaxID=1400762 RepID=A0A9P5X9H1_9AGAR|nr:hypothetical protein P691DRAFT_784188 [Macrolepiota fuliginosa MF-IS2]
MRLENTKIACGQSFESDPDQTYKNSKNVYVLEERRNLFDGDLNVPKFDANVSSATSATNGSASQCMIIYGLRKLPKSQAKGGKSALYNHHSDHHRQPQRQTTSPRQYSPEPQQAHESRGRNAEQHAATLHPEMGPVAPGQLGLSGRY